MNLQEKIKFQIKCPKCATPIDANGKDAGKELICPNCEAVIHLVDNGFTKGINDVEKMLKSIVKH